MARSHLTFSELNELDRDGFTAALGSVFEGPPWIVAQAWPARPFHGLEHLHQALRAVLYDAPVERQVALIQAHPDLVGRAALAGTLTAESTREQAAAGLDRLSPEEIAAFTRYNTEYRDRFGFPFVICARENKKAGILAGLAARLGHSREQEIAAALAEIIKIARLRLGDVIEQVSNGDQAVQTDYDYTISYGKKCVPVYRVYARPLTGLTPIPESEFTERANTLFATEIDVEVFGANFLPAYTHGDNSSVVATDSMKNFVLKQSLAYDGATLEGLLDFLGRRFLQTYPQMHALRLTAREQPFVAARVPEEAGTGFADSDVLFSRSHDDFTVAVLDCDNTDGGYRLTGHRCGRQAMQLLKVTGSAFTRFVRDEHTTLPERGDRPLFIYLDLSWTYLDPREMLAGDASRYIAAEQVRDVVQTVFHELVSESIQHLVHEMGQRLLARFPQMAEITFEGQNRTPDPAAVSADGSRLKVYTSPFPAYGLIRLAMKRR